MTDPSLSRGELTRQDILTAANQLFNQQGYHGTSMRQIAERAGIALGGIYNHFPGKETIFLAVLEQHHPVLMVLPALTAAQGETIEERVQDAARRMMAKMGDHLDFLNLMFIEMVEFNSSHLGGMFQEHYPQLSQLAAHLLQAGGTLRPVPVPIMVRVFISLFISYIVTEMLVGSVMPAELRQEAFKHFVDIYLHGILEPDPPSMEA
jgi:AcrR family transcriptional regulator